MERTFPVITYKGKPFTVGKDKIPWLMNSPDTVTLKTTNKYIYIK